MTEKEAIKILEMFLHKQCDLERIIPVYDANEVWLAVKMATRAIEKQIPKKPIFVDTRFRHHGKHISDGISLSKCYKCPCCNRHIFHVWDDEEYCNRCGQKLDWKEEE